MAQTTRASKEKLRISWGKRWLDALNNYLRFCTTGLDNLLRSDKSSRQDQYNRIHASGIHKDTKDLSEKQIWVLFEIFRIYQIALAVVQILCVVSLLAVGVGLAMNRVGGLPDYFSSLLCILLIVLGGVLIVGSAFPVWRVWQCWANKEREFAKLLQLRGQSPTTQPPQPPWKP